jgi:hypothetical protein
LKRALEIDPQNFIVHWCIGYTYALVDRLPDALHHASVLQKAAPLAAYTLQLLSLIDGLEGRGEAALERITGLNITPLDSHQIFHLAESFILAGDHVRGLELLERSVSGFYPYPYLADYCRFLDPVRDAPRFQAVLRSARENVEQFAQREAALN